MGTTHVPCPRCDATGLIVTSAGQQYGNRRAVEASCPVCRGTGKASMLEPMGGKKK